MGVRAFFWYKRTAGANNKPAPRARGVTGVGTRARWFPETRVGGGWGRVVLAYMAGAKISFYALSRGRYMWNDPRSFLSTSSATTKSH